MNGFSLSQELEQRGVSRRDFLGFCASMATIMGLPGAVTAIAAAVENENRPILVWLEFQDCAGNTESFLRASHPTVADLILDTISLNYHETLMAAAGSQAESALEADGRRTTRANTLPLSKAPFRPAPTAPTARSAAEPLSRSRARSAAALRRPSRSAPARRLAASRRPRRTRPARYLSPTRCPASRT